jgi:sugar/nucleoside kinase (ribokinase family)
MLIPSRFEPIDYLVIGHLTQDITPEGPKLGGTAAFAALTARALGLRVGIVTSCSNDTPIKILEGIQLAVFPSEYSTTFKNINTPNGRIQHIYHVAANLDISMVPETWRAAPIIHLGPVAQEVEPTLVQYFPNSLIGLTPQGWLRSWDKEGRVCGSEWPEARYVLEKSTAVVLSIEDVQKDEDRIEEMASSIRVLVVTEAAEGARLFWNGDVRRFRPPKVVEIDPIGAGDIFSALFFYRLHSTKDPWEAVRFATYLSACSVTRPGLAGIPTSDEIDACKIEIVQPL